MPLDEDKMIDSIDKLQMVVKLAIHKFTAEVSMRKRKSRNKLNIMRRLAKAAERKKGGMIPKQGHMSGPRPVK